MEAPTAGNEEDKLILEEVEKNKDDDYSLAKDYYSNDNPFTKVMIGAGAGVIGGYSAAIVALGISEAFIAGGILFYDTPFLVAGGASLFGMASIVVTIPAVIGTIAYGIYKFTKTQQLKEFMKKLSDQNNNTMNEERKIFSLLLEETKNFFQLRLKEYFMSKAKDIILENTQDIIDKINKSRKEKKEINLQNDVQELRYQITGMINENILILGSTGVGKSTLINEFLNLKDNKAPEGKTAIPQKINEWPKKYPVNPGDTEIKGINIYDTEGIEKTDEGNNDLNTHLNRIATFISNPDTKLNEKMNIIWYCISGNKLDGDEKYINKILNMYNSKVKIPIIFVYTKAYASKEDEIDAIHNGLKEFQYFKNNEDELNFIEVIAKDMVSKKSGKVIEEKKGLKELMDFTISLSEKSILSPIYQQISGFYNKRGNNKIKLLSSKLQEQYTDIVVNHDKFKTLKDKFYDIFECMYGEYINDNERIKLYIKDRLEEPFRILEKIKDNELKKISKDFDKKYLISKTLNDITNLYNEKKTNKKKFEDFKKDIEDFLITQINNSKDIYGLFFLFDMFRDSMLEIILNDLKNNLTEIKIEATKKLQHEIDTKIKEFKCLFVK